MPFRHLKSFAVIITGSLLWVACAPVFVWAQRLRTANGGSDEYTREQPYEHPTFSQNFSSDTVAVPAGTLIITQMLTKLSSKTAQPGDRLRAKVIVPINDRSGRTLIPVGSTIEGQVQDVLRAKSRRRSGMLEISFDRLRLPDGQAIPLRAALAPATAEDRRRLDDDGRLLGKEGGAKRTLAFVGGGAAAGAVIGYVTIGAVLGGGVGAGVGAVALLLSKGHEAIVEPGMKIGAELSSPIQVRASGSRSGRTETSQLDPYRPGTQTDRPNYDRQPDYTPPRDTYPPPTIPKYDPYETRPTLPKYDPNETRPVTKPTPRPTPRTTPTPKPPTYTEPGDSSINRADLELVGLMNMLAERGSDETVRVSLTAQTPTAGWRLAPESTVQNGVLTIKLLGAPPRGLAAQVMSTASTVVVKPDPNRQIERVIIRSSTGVRTTVPLARGQQNNAGGSGSGSSSSGATTSSPMGLRIADKSDALVEDFARTLRAWKQTRDGRYSFDNPRDEGTPEAQLLYAFDRLSESANVFRTSLTSERKRAAVRDLVNANKAIERLWPYVKVTVDIKQRWQEIQRDSNQLAATVPGSTTSTGPLRPRS